MGSPAIFSGKFTKLLTQLGIMQSNGALIQNDGPKNYIKYSQFENAATTGWSLGTTGALTSAIPTGTPTFGSGASGTLAITAQTTGALSGSYSLQLADSAATTAGNMVSTAALTIDPSDQAKVLTFKFNYSVTANPTNGNFSGTSSNTFGVACYDVTNSSWIPVVGNFSMTQSSGTGIATGTMQTNSTTASVRFMVYVANASTGAITMLMDDFYLGPQTAPIGSVITDWQSYTPTFVGFGTVASIQMQYRRVGDSIEIAGNFTQGTPTAVTASFSLPTGLTSSDTTKIPATRIVGHYGLSVSGLAGYELIAGPSSTTINFAYQNGSNGTLTAQQGSTIAAGAAIFTVFAKLPIQGWGGTTQMSGDTDTRVISFSGTIGAQAVTANVTNVTMTATKDTAGAWGGSSYTVPVSGDYVVSGGSVNSVADSGLIYVDGSFYSGAQFSSVGAGTFSGGAHLIPGLRAGQTVSYRAAGTGTLASGRVSIFRLSGPSVIAASESVGARYTGTAGGSIGTSLTQQAFATKDYDSHNAFSGTSYTCPVSGKYNVYAKLTTAAVTLSTSQGLNLQLYKNGSFFSDLALPAGSGAAFNVRVSGGDDVNCVAGDTLSIYASSSVATTQSTTAGYNYITIKRVGN